ncbi:MAG: cytochrome c [Bacteroidota bacterium]|nr:cytochrome c [Bacteroidota bacterium]
MKRSIIISALLIAVFYSCTHDNLKPGNTTGTGSKTGGVTPPPPPPLSDSVCFKNDVLPLFQTYCASTGCHDGTSRGEDNNLALTNYANIMQGIVPGNAGESRYYTIIAEGTMPPGNAPKLSSTQLATIATWINQGALNKTCTVPVCDTTKMTYTNGVSQIFATYCNGCHGVAPGSGNVVLSSYASAKAAGTGLKVAFLNAINYTSANAAMNMPQSGKLSSCQINQITRWINNGCPQ